MSITTTEQDAVLPIYKPRGMTSFGMVRTVRNQLNLRKVGHAGTLDPLAEGLLIILTGKKTKLMGEFLKMDKEYHATLQLGVESSSHDLETGVTERVKDLDLSLAQLEDALKKFTGRIEQVPPAYSAKWLDGKRAYRLARQNVGFELKPKLVTIEKIEIQSFNCPFVDLRVVCSSGTYIRSLARDIGTELGCGAVLAKLIRTRIGTYTVEAAIRLEDSRIGSAA